MYERDIFKNAYQAAIQSFPDILLHIEDLYISQLLHQLSLEKQL